MEFTRRRQGRPRWTFPTRDKIIRWSLCSDHEKLKTEIQRLLKISADRDWAVQKTNQSIKILYKELSRRTGNCKSSTS